MDYILNKVWDSKLQEQFDRQYFSDLLDSVYPKDPCTVTLPPASEVFTAFNLVDLPDVKAVIIGQDPYPTRGNAHGLSFSVKVGVAIPASLRNIFQELEMEYPDFRRPLSGDLTAWAKQGVLLLNKVLTVQEGFPNSHKDLGWERFTREVLYHIDTECDHVVYMLWGKDAELVASSLKNPNRLVLTAPHPSPLSAYRGFFGCGHFKQTNEYLESHAKPSIVWQL